MKTNEIFISTNSIADNFIKSFDFAFQVLPEIKKIIIELGNKLDDNFFKIGDNIWIHKNSNVSKSAEIIGPCIIDDGAEIRHNAYIRGNVIIGKKSVLGNSCEIKNSILYDFVQVPHFNYVGDSILGSYAHLGAGTIISNLKSDKKNIIIKYKDEIIETGMRKIGAFIGDSVEVGCGCVLNPGTIILSKSTIYPLINVRGFIDSNMIVKNMQNIIEKEVR